MKVFVALAFIVATASAGFVQPFEKPVLPRDLAVIFDEPTGRITNGQAASEGQIPYQVGLSFTGSSGSWWCGGSLIDASWVLTAAHCTSGGSSVTVYLGATKRTSPKQTQTVSSSNFVQHASYSSSTLANDISLIQISSVTLTSYINIIALPAISTSYSTYSGEIAQASGWGLTSDSATTVSSQLQYANMTVIDNSVCAKTYGSRVVTSNTICTKVVSSVSTCSGDSGGPLVLVSESVQIGVTSFVSSSGCESGAPDGFVRVTSYLDWIKTNSGVSY